MTQLLAGVFMRPSRLLAVACVATTLSAAAADPPRDGPESGQPAKAKEHDAGAPADAARLPLTGAEVQRICARLSPCIGDLPEIEAFCDLAGGADGGAWRKTVVPARSVLEAARCPEGVRAPAVALTQNFGLERMLAFDQSALLWGATDFLVSRAEQELRDWAIDRFLDSVCDDGKYARLGGEPIFPTSCPVIRGAHLAGFLAGMATYQGAMRKDLAHLPVLVARQCASKAVGRRRDPAYVSLELAHALEQVVAGTAPVLSLRHAATDLEGIELDCGKVPIASRLFQAASLLASIPVSGRGVELPSDAKGWAYTFMALAVNATDPGSGIARMWPRDCPEQRAITPGAAPFDPVALAKTGGAIKTAVADGFRAAEELRKLPAGGDPAQRLELYGRLAAGLVQTAQALLAVDPDLDATHPELGVIFRAMEKLSHDVASANYAAVALDLGGMAAFAAPKGEALPPEFLRVVSFGVDVAQARDADSAAAAIERFAAPPGAHQRKRSGGGYAGVNAYAGLLLGGEKAQQAAGGWADAKWAFAPGFWVPVGVELGTAGRWGSGGLLLQAVDLGVLASWRVGASEDEVASRPVVGWNQVFSPGAALVYGIPGAPLSIAASLAVSPRLRTLKEGDATNERNAFRVGLSLAVDIPIFP